MPSQCAVPVPDHLNTNVARGVHCHVSVLLWAIYGHKGSVLLAGVCHAFSILHSMLPECCAQAHFSPRTAGLSGVAPGLAQGVDPAIAAAVAAAAARYNPQANQQVWNTSCCCSVDRYRCPWFGLYFACCLGPLWAAFLADAEPPFLALFDI